MRLLRFFLIFIGTALLVVGSIFWLNRDTFVTVFQNRAAILEGSEWVEKTYSLAGLIEYMAEQPQHAAFASIPSQPGDDGIAPAAGTDNTGVRYNDAGNGGDGRFEIRYQSGRILPAAGLSRLMLVITYAERVGSGELDPDAPVDIRRITPFYFPEADRRHLRNLENRFGENGEPPVLKELVRYMAQSNDPAVADYLFFRLGPDRVAETTYRISGGRIEPPVPQYGIRTMAQQFHPDTTTLSRHLDRLLESDREWFLTEAVETARRQWEEPKPVEETSIRFFQDQRSLHNLFPGIEPDTFGSMLVDIWNGTLTGPETDAEIRSLIRRTADDRLLEPHISDYAAHFDERMGNMSGWTVATAQKTGKIRAQVIILHDLPAGLWFHMNSNFMIRDFHHRMLYDPTIRSRSFELLHHGGQARNLP
ncbi:serine hydrolase [Balneolales bacterium ANBcel1]|nr:serine hydrolase [Balneolales bacterium ANBcel1]